MIANPSRPPAQTVPPHYGEAMSGVRRLRVVTAPDIELAVTVVDQTSHRTGSGLPVLLLHGLSQQQAFWDPVVRRLRTRPVAVVDQRGHGASDTPAAADYSVAACADDALAVLSHLGWDRAIVVGHSWGASVALATAARRPERVPAAVLLDGGLWSPADLGPRDEVRERLTPPSLGIPSDRLWAMVSGGELAPWWRPEAPAALAPTFVEDDDGLVRTRLGMERHLRVLDGLLDHDVPADLRTSGAAGVRTWAVVCEPASSSPEIAPSDDWSRARSAGIDRAAATPNCVVHRWAGALHDVPLQWPALVAGLVDAVVEDVGGGDA